MWTFPPHRILVAVDFGDASAQALRVAGDLARAFEATLVALHGESFDAPPYFTADQVKTIQRQRRAARSEAARYLGRFAERLTRLAVAPVISDAPPADAILEASRQSDLIVMGTHGRRGPARWWAGSVAERVVREARVPVLVVRSTPPLANQVFRRIAVVAGRGTFDGPARRYAKGLATAFEGESTRESATTVTSTTLEGASLVVVAKPPRASRFGGGTGAAESVLRSCRRPILFVPPV